MVNFVCLVKVSELSEVNVQFQINFSNWGLLLYVFIHIFF